MAFLEQDVVWPDTVSLFDAVVSKTGELSAVQSSMKNLENALADESSPELLTRYGELQQRFELLGGYEIEHRAERVLEGLNLDSSLWTRPARPAVRRAATQGRTCTGALAGVGYFASRTSRDKPP